MLRRKLTKDEFVLLFKIHQNEKKISDNDKLQDEEQYNTYPLNGTWG